MKYTDETIFKVLPSNRVSYYAGYHWPEIGIWTSKLTPPLRPCSYGYHGAQGPQQVLQWIHAGENLYVMELEDVDTSHDDKVVGSRARLIEWVETWNNRTKYLLLADYAERLFKHFNPDQIPDYPDVRNDLQVIVNAVRKQADGSLSAGQRTTIKQVAERIYGEVTDLPGYYPNIYIARAALSMAYSFRAEYAIGDLIFNHYNTISTLHVSTLAQEKEWHGAQLLAYLNGEVS